MEASAQNIINSPVTFFRKFLHSLSNGGPLAQAAVVMPQQEGLVLIRHGSKTIPLRSAAPAQGIK